MLLLRTPSLTLSLHLPGLMSTSARPLSILCYKQRRIFNITRQNQPWMWNQNFAPNCINNAAARRNAMHFLFPQFEYFVSPLQHSVKYIYHLHHHPKSSNDFVQIKMSNLLVFIYSKSTYFENRCATPDTLNQGFFFFFGFIFSELCIVP